MRCATRFSCRGEVLWDVLGSHAKQRIDGRSSLATSFGHEVGVVVEGDGRAGTAEPSGEGDDGFTGFEDDRGVGVPEDVAAVLARCLPTLPLLPKGDDACLREGGLPYFVVELSRNSRPCGVATTTTSQARSCATVMSLPTSPAIPAARIMTYKKGLSCGSVTGRSQSAAEVVELWQRTTAASGNESSSASMPPDRRRRSAPRGPAGLREG